MGFPYSLPIEFFTRNPVSSSLDHAALAVERLITILKETTVQDLIEAIATTSNQAVDEATVAVIDARTLDGATGVQLDLIGTVVGQPRNGLSDDADYRLRLRARIAINRSGGTAEDILSAVDLLITSSQTLELREEFPAALTLFVLSAAVSNPDEINLALQNLKSSGVSARLQYANDTAANTFTLDGTSAQGMDNGILTDIVE